MSIAASNWAKKQRIGSAYGKSVLRELCDCADQTGFCFPSPEYIAECAEVSRASVFRWLKVFECIGALLRGKEVRPDGSTVHTIRLNFDCVVDAAAVTRAFSGEQDTNESHCETQNPGDTARESHCETPSSLTVRLIESHSSDSNEPSLEPKNPPKTPLPPREAAPTTKPTNPLRFATFWSRYPEHEALIGRKEAAKVEFAKLDDADQQRTIDRIELYASHIRKLNRRPINPDRWIRDRGFDEYTPGMSAATSKPTFVAVGSAQHQAWSNYYAVAKGCLPKIPHFRQARQGGEDGASMPAEWPLGGEGWLVPYDDWVFVAEGTAQFRRWTERVGEINSGSGTALLRATSEDHRRKLFAPNAGKWGDRDFRGLRVPLEWPPAKSERANTTGPPEEGLSDADAEAFTNVA